MIDLFLRQTPDQLREVRAALAVGDLGGVQRVAHSLKSSAGNFGARAVQELAFQIERAAAESDASHLAERVGQLEQAYERVRGYLEAQK
jgi:HPt (histidine-containing phosphotransfer) domain-containing protein